MTEQKETAGTAKEAEDLDKGPELADEDLDKVAGGHASLGDSMNKIHDKVGHGESKIGVDISKIGGIL